jgi:hypothetical protein
MLIVSKKEHLSDRVCYSFLLFLNYDTIDEILKKYIYYSFIVLASEEMQKAFWSMILAIRRQLSLIVPYDVYRCLD